jgi:uncharacterized protein YjdB
MQKGGSSSKLTNSKGLKYNKSIDQLRKQEMDEVIVERSEKSLE